MKNNLKIFIALFLVFGLLSPYFPLSNNKAEVNAEGWLTGWDQRIKLTIDYTKVDSTLTWFPVTVFLTSTQGEEVFTEFDADSDYLKVAFTTDDGTTELYAEKELFDDAGQKAVYHVSKTGWEISSTANTEFYIYYDNDHADNTTYIGAIDSTPGHSVWDGSFAAVYHMVDASSSLISDSTSNGYDANKFGANEPIQTTNVQTGYGQQYDGTNDRVIISTSINTITAFDEDSTWTLESLSLVESGSPTSYMMCRRRYQSSGTAVKARTAASGTVIEALQPTLDTGNFHYYAGTYQKVSGTPTMIAYRDGTLSNSDTCSDQSFDYGISDFWIGGTTHGDGTYLIGKISEARISLIVRSASWIKATYNSLWDTLLTYGNQEDATVAPTVSTQAATDITENTATIHGNVTSDGGSTITERGFYCDTNETPTTKYIVSGTTGTFEKALATLTEGTPYYFKAYATNENGTSYGDTLSFTTFGWLTGWDQRIKLTIDYTKVDNTLTHFPVTVFLTSTQGEEVFTEFDADSDYLKVAFTKDDGTTELYAEKELFDDAGQKAVYHVSKTGWEISSTANTEFYIYYDNDHADNTTYIGAIDTTAGGNVWNGDFMAVWHMTDATTSTIKDSTSNNRDLTKEAANEPTEVAGKISTAQNYDGDEYIDTGWQPDLDYDTVTIENVTRISDNSVNNTTIAQKWGRDGAAYSGFSLYWRPDAVTNEFNIGDGVGGVSYFRADDGVPAEDTWYYTAAVREDQGGGNAIGYLYTDGALTATSSLKESGNDATTDRNVTIGIAYTFEWRGPMFGDIDETRMSLTRRTAAWIKATYNSLWDTLLTYGNQEDAAFAPTVSTQAATDITENTATIHGNVTSDGGSTIAERGFYCDTNETPTTKYIVSGTTGIFEKALATLTEGTPYYFKAYATNENGTSYGDTLSFTTSSGQLTGWDYRRAITIDNTGGGALTDYQVSVDTDSALYNESGLVGSWHMNENSGIVISDSSSNSNNGTASGTTIIDGKFGKARSFNGSSDYVNCGTGLNSITEFTVEAWVKVNNLDSSQGIFVLGSGDNSWGFRYRIGSNGEAWLLMAGGGGYDTLSSTDLIAAGEWHHIVAVGIPGNSMKLYVDGNETSKSTSQVMDAPTGNTFIGSAWNTTTELMNGSIDEVRIYNRALPADEISAHFNASKVRLDYGDVRFTDSDGTTELNYWMEKDGTFWTKVPSISASSQKTIYMYYGNASATAQSNGDNTFDFFDDFNSDTTADYSWTTVDANAPTNSHNWDSVNKWVEIITGDNDDENLSKSITLPSSGYAKIEMIKRVDYPSDNVQYILIKQDDNNYYRFLWTGSGYATQGVGKVVAAATTDSSVETGTVDTNGQEFIIEIWWTPNSLRLDINGTTRKNITTTNTTQLNPSSFFFRNNQIDHDWESIVIRKYTSPEPTVSIYAEQNNYTFTYRKAVTIDNTSNANTLYDYQVLVETDTATPITAGNMNSDCSDIRFTDDSANWNDHNWDYSYSYWIESGCNTATTKILVKVPSITASSQKTTYMYYGNVSVTSQSNGDNTFEFFDDFDGTSVDTDKWNIPVGSPTVSGGTATFNDDRLTGKTTYGGGYVVEAYAKNIDDGAYNTIGFGGFWHTAAERGGTTITGWITGDVLVRQAADGDSVAGLDLKIGSWANFKIYNGGADSLDWVFCADSSCVSPSPTQTAAIPSPPALGAYNVNSNLEVDWIFVRKYASPEPTTQVGTEGIENESPAISSVSDTPDPLQAGNDVSFEVSWSDPDSGDQTKIHICKTDAITTQTCDGGSWCNTTEWSTTSPTSCDYTTQVGDIGTKNYYAFISDDSDESSTSTAGTFEVTANATSTISSISDAPDPIPANSSILFTVNWSDPGDQIKIHICKTDAITGQTCDGGFWCNSSEFSTSSPSTCTYTTQLADLGTQNYYAFVCDSVNNHSISEIGTFEVVRLNPSNSLTLATTTSSGFLTSSIFDSGVNGGASFHSLLWQGTLCGSCLVKLQLASSNSSSGPWTYYGPTSTSDYYSPNPGVVMTLPRNGDAAHQNKRYIRYKVYLEPYDSQSPEIDDIVINWSP